MSSKKKNDRPSGAAGDTRVVPISSARSEREKKQPAKVTARASVNAAPDANNGECLEKNGNPNVTRIVGEAIKSEPDPAPASAAGNTRVVPPQAVSPKPSPPLSARPASDVTRLESQADRQKRRQNAAAKRQPVDKTAITPHRPVPAPEAGDYTEFASTKGANSTGFRKAKDIARKVRENKGLLLKKRFVLESVLGQGGMGVVYKAKDLRKVEAEDINPYVATKVLNDSFKDHPHAFVALQQEAVKSQRLAHPNIVTVHDFDRDGDTIFITMELLEGKPLDRLLKKYKGVGLGKERSIAIFRDLCAALSYAHARDIIHADFKPGNIFYSREGVAKVLDFGIAQAASKEKQQGQFDAGQLGALTPSHASKEMLEGQAPQFSDDVYALACVFYEMLSGRHPFDRQPADQAFAMGLQPKKIEALSSRQWKALNKALALRREDRTQTVDEFLRAFEPARKTAMLSIVAVVVLSALAGGGWNVYQQQRLENERRAAIADNLNRAGACYRQGNFKCAQERSAMVLSLAPGHTEAKRLLDQARHAEAEAARAADLAADLANLLEQANSCLLEGNLECATLFATKAEEIDALHEGVMSVKERINTVILRRNEQALAREREIAELINNANRCFRAQDYACVLREVENVFALDANNAEAFELKQSATVAQEREALAEARRIQNAKTVEKIMRQAETCFKVSNFSCAIARSESALDVIPDNEAALLMKKRAIEAQEALKRSISIN